MSATEAHCDACGKTTLFQHLHDAAHGIPETHMVGTERFECTGCGATVYAVDARPPFLFILDNVTMRP